MPLEAAGVGFSAAGAGCKPLDKSAGVWPLPLEEQDNHVNRWATSPDQTSAQNTRQGSWRQSGFSKNPLLTQNKPLLHRGRGPLKTWWRWPYVVLFLCVCLCRHTCAICGSQNKGLPSPCGGPGIRQVLWPAQLTELSHLPVDIGWLVFPVNLVYLWLSWNSLFRLRSTCLCIPVLRLKACVTISQSFLRLSRRDTFLIFFWFK